MLRLLESLEEALCQHDWESALDLEDQLRIWLLQMPDITLHKLHSALVYWAVLMECRSSGHPAALETPVAPAHDRVIEAISASRTALALDQHRHQPEA